MYTYLITGATSDIGLELIKPLPKTVTGLFFGVLAAVKKSRDFAEKITLISTIIPLTFQTPRTQKDL